MKFSYVLFLIQAYLKQKEAIDPANKFKDEEEPKEHKQIRGLLDSLFSKLDGLSNYHYTPVPVSTSVTRRSSRLVMLEAINSLFVSSRE